MRTLIISFKVFLFFTILTGIIYPLIVTGLAQVAFPVKANGSLIVSDGKIAGSALIGQNFDSSVYFSSRPSAVDYNPMPSGGSNYGLTNEKLRKLVTERRIDFIACNKLDSITEVPPEMLFASASGLDPHISPQSAFLQSDRIAKVRKLSYAQKLKLLQLIELQIESPQFSIFGEERVNVLLLNIELDSLAQINEKPIEDKTNNVRNSL